MADAGRSAATVASGGMTGISPFLFCFDFFSGAFVIMEPGRGEPGRCLWVKFLGGYGVGFAAMRN
jgi:hypothetical protein